MCSLGGSWDECVEGCEDIDWWCDERWIWLDGGESTDMWVEDDCSGWEEWEVGSYNWWGFWILVELKVGRFAGYNLWVCDECGGWNNIEMWWGDWMRVGEDELMRMMEVKMLETESEIIKKVKYEEYL